MRGDDLVTREVRVTQLDLDAIAQRRKHVGKQQHLFPLWMVALYGRRLALVDITQKRLLNGTL